MTKRYRVTFSDTKSILIEPSMYEGHLRLTIAAQWKKKASTEWNFSKSVISLPFETDSDKEKVAKISKVLKMVTGL